MADDNPARKLVGQAGAALARVPPVAWLVLGGLAALAIGSRVEAATPVTTLVPGRTYRVEWEVLEPALPTADLVPQILRTGFKEILASGQGEGLPARNFAQAIARWAPAPGETGSTDKLRMTRFVDILKPPGEPRDVMPAVAQQQTPPELQQAISWALTFDRDVQRLAGFAASLKARSAAGRSYPLPASFIRARTKVLLDDVVRVPPPTSTPAVSGTPRARVGQLFYLAPYLGALFTGAPVAGAAFASGADEIAAKVIREGSEQVKDFAKTDFGWWALRIMSTYGFYVIAPMIGYPVIASAVFAVPGMLRGDEFTKAWIEELIWRIQETIRFFAGNLAPQLVGKTVKEIEDMAASGSWPEIRQIWDRLRPPLQKFASDIPVGASILNGQLRAAGIEPGAQIDRVRAELDRRFGSPVDLRKMANEFGIREDAAASIYDLFARDPKLAAMKRDFSLETGRDLSPFSRNPITPGGANVNTDAIQILLQATLAERARIANEILVAQLDFYYVPTYQSLAAGSPQVV